MAQKKKTIKKKAVAVKKAVKPASKPAPKAAVVKAKPAPKKKVAKVSAKKVAPVAKRLPMPVPPVLPKVAVKTPPPTKMKPLSAKELEEFRAALKNVRDRVVDEITFLSGDNLNRSQRESSGDLSSYSFHMADQGTDNFDREFALNLVSSEQDALYEIDEALHRLDDGSYGACETCGCAIEKARLKALPFAKMCIACKSQAEKGKTRYRPFGQTIAQSTAAESSQ